MQTYAQSAEFAPLHDAQGLLEEAHRYGSDKKRRLTKHLFMRLGLLTMLLLACIIVLLSSSQRFSQICTIRSLDGCNIVSSSRANSPFTGAFSQFPRQDMMLSTQKKLNLIGMWTHDDTPPHLRHFFHSAQLNADSIDVLFINRIIDPQRSCIDFNKSQIDITWGGNIKFVCMSLYEWKKRHVDFMCSKTHGWNCDADQWHDVFTAMQDKVDERNYHWRPLRGWVFQDLLPNKMTPFWAWADHDLFLGNFNKFPFNILSRLALISFGTSNINEGILAGQLTAFNMNDAHIASFWRKTPTLKTAEHFIKGIVGQYKTNAEEQEWSFQYLNLEEHDQSPSLSFALLPDMIGDDQYNHIPEDRTNTSFIISGRDILYLKTDEMSRSQLEALILLERRRPFDENAIWSSGYDGSDQMLIDPGLQDRDLKKEIQLSQPYEHSDIFDGILESVQWSHGSTCVEGSWIKPQYRVCVPPHSLSQGHSSPLRTSLVRLKGQHPGYLFRRLEHDKRGVSHSRKLVRHFLRSKHKRWGQLPPFDITEKHILQIKVDQITAWRTGSERNQTLYHRQQDPNLDIG